MSAPGPMRKPSGSGPSSASTQNHNSDGTYLDLSRTMSARPRGSISSNRSRATAEDFEAALREPSKTLFLSSTPQGVEEGGSADGEPVDPPIVQTADRPEPIPKRSFEEDMQGFGTVRRGSARTGTSNGSAPAPLATLTPVKSGLPALGGIIPPTPSTIASTARRESVATTESTGSSPATSRTQRYRGQAVGIEDEVASMQKSVKKRRSIFRSAGTASSSDLSKSVRGPAPPAASSSRSNGPHAAQGSGLSNGPGTIRRGPSETATVRSNGASSSAGGSTFSGSTTQTAVWAGSQGGPPEPKRQPSDEGFKTMRSKARGMFGRMFGSGKEPSSSSSTSRSPHMSPPLNPPTPPALAAPIASTSRSVSGPVAQSADVFGTVRGPASTSTGSTPRLPTDSSIASLAVSDGRRSVTPTVRGSPVPSGLGIAGQIPSSDRLRTVSTESRASGGSDKPLPPIVPDDEDEAPPSHFATLGRGTLHTRQPAYSIQDSTPERPPERGRIPSFSEDVGDALASIGHKPLAQGLGLPPDAVRLADPISDTRPVDQSTIRRLPSNLSRADSLSGQGPPVPTQRISSLPSQSDESGSSQHIPLGKTISRTSARSISPAVARRPSAAEAQPLSPIDPMGDFGPPPVASSQTDGGATARGGHDTIRLVHSPSVDSTRIMELSGEYPSAAAVVRANLRPNALRATSMVSTASELEGEDDEEKGRKLACEFLEGNYEHIASDKVAMFLGGARPVNGYALRYYMQYFDMKGQNLVEAFRDLCAKLHLKAESQEIDRIIEGFSARYYECNPNTIYGSPGVVHTVTGAMLMLNTDLHVADLSKHMSRADFVRNAMRAIQESQPDHSSTPTLTRSDSDRFETDSTFGTPPRAVAPSLSHPQHPPATHRSASVPAMGHPVSLARHASEAGLNLESKSRSSSTNIGSMYSKAWEAEAENVLKDIYSAVRSERILLPTSSASASNRQSMISLAPSDRYKTMRSPSDRINALKRGSVRMPSNNNPYAGNFASSDGRLSPTPSYATSINETMNVSLGFASNLSHTVIREHEDETRSVDSTASLSTLDDDMNDDELALLGAPWAKEGMLQHKLFLDGTGKRPKKLEWKQYFSVVSLGELFMFVFGESGGGSFSMGGGAVGGGNWLQNAKPTGTIELMHSLSLPVPRSSQMADKPHCFSLTASSGAVTLFQAGTDDLVTEWVSTCNYWAARRSRQPLAGGVSNMEYGWQKVQHVSGSSQKDEDDMASIRSGRSNMSKIGTYGRKPMMPSDRMHINDWRPPPPATMPSPLDEETQLDTLQVYAQSLRKELDEHRALEDPMNRQYAPGSKNAIKAKDNFRAKATYLSGEIAKYDTYIDSLKQAIAMRLKKAGERRLEKSLMRSNASLHRRGSEASPDMAHTATVESFSTHISGQRRHTAENDEYDDEDHDAFELIRDREVRVDPTSGDDLGLGDLNLGNGGTIRASRAH